MRRTDTQVSNGHSFSMDSWRWWTDPETLAWRGRLDGWIEEQRASTSVRSSPSTFATPIPTGVEHPALPIGPVVQPGTRARDALGRYRRQEAS